ncbi:MAG: hypothetical protein H8F28_25330, partial [Fibrella sp.]|nr:hypothetical protein [Armatimonadota bacterium]
MLRSHLPYSLSLYLFLASLSAFSMPSLAQSLEGSSRQGAVVRKSTGSYLDRIRYDPRTSGPLIWITGSPELPVSSAQETLPAGETGKETARQFADRLGCRIFAQNTLTVIAPRDQRVIADVPQKPADPFAKMSSRERFSVLLSLLSREQWRAATSEKGIGVEEMTEEQRSLWSSLLPSDKISLQKNRLIPTGDRAYNYEKDGEPREFSPDIARLRLVRRIHFLFQRVGAEDSRYSSSTDGPVGDDPGTVYTGNVEYTPDEHRADGSNPVQAFGATILQTVPNRSKKSDLDLASPALNVAVPLETETETIRELVERTGKSIRLNLRCDKRVGDLKVFRRVVPGATVSASDLLQSVCLGVCGTFRKITPATGEPIYLLTHDTEGIGSRFLRWSDWSEEAVQKRYNTVENASNKSAAVDPLDMIGFAPNDPYALPPALLTRVDAAYRKQRFGTAPEFKMSELPLALRKEAQASIAWWGKNGAALRTDTLRVGTELTCQLLLPGGIAVEPASYGRDFGGQYLQKIAVIEKRTVAAKTTKPEPPAKPVALPIVPGRRVLLLPLPIESEEVQRVLRAAQRKGFTDAWLRVPLEIDEKQKARLVAAVRFGTKMGLRVGAVVDILRGYKGVPDVNLFGETGAAFADRKIAANPERDYYARQFPHWNVWNENTIKSGLVSLASVPDLSALTLQATAAPGHAGVVRGGDGIPPGGHLGYTVETRLACLEA